MDDGQRHTRRCCWTFLGGACGTLATLAFLRWGPALGEDSLTFAGLVLVCSFSLAVVALFAGVGPLLANCVSNRLLSHRRETEMKKITAVLLVVFIAGLVIVMIPSYQDIGLHWSLVVSRLNMYLPGLGMMLGAGSALVWLEYK